MNFQKKYETKKEKTKMIITIFCTYKAICKHHTFFFEKVVARLESRSTIGVKKKNRI